ncbi:MAG TPA: ABC transporter substrate-binding protein [Rhodocyclaceae bacterium]|nr:ABC transporter substrate-binding protein [Rhodocyclaceae bacterium]
MNRTILTALRSAAGVLSVASAVALAAPAPDAIAIKPGGELVFGLDGAQVSEFILDPANSSFAPHNRVFRSIFDSLVVLKQDQTVGPWLAESWEISPDRKTYTFKLRKDVKFHDGTPFNAAAVKYNLDRIAEPKNALAALIDLGPYQSSEVVNANTLRIKLSEPYEPLLRNLSKTTSGISSPAAIAKYGDAYALNPVGTGPFKLISLQQGTEIKLARNPDYKWAPPTAAHQGPAYLDKLTFRNVPEESTRVAVLQSNQVQAIDGIPPQNFVLFKNDPNYRVYLKELLNNNYALALNVAKAPWNDEEIRKAFRLSVDIDTIVKVIYLGSAPRAWSQLSPSLFGSAEKDLFRSWKPDLAQAQQILDKKGWVVGKDGIRVKDGKRLTVSFIDTQGNREKRLDVIQLVRRHVAKAGFELTIDSQPAGAYRTKIANLEYDLSAGSQFAPDPDVLRRLFSPEGRAKTSGYKIDDPEITQWLKDGLKENDPAKRAEIYKKVQRKLVDKAYTIPVYVLLYAIGTTKDVNGLTIDAQGFPEFQGVWLSSKAEKG